MPGVVDIDKAGTFAQTLNLAVDRERCRAMGIQPAEVELVVQLAQRKMPIDRLEIEVSQVCLTLRRAAPEEIEGLDAVVNVKVADSEGRLVPLGAVAKIQLAFAATLVYRDAARSGIVISCNVEGGEAEAVRGEIEKVAGELSKEGVRIELD